MKRFLDILLVLPALIILSPLMALIAVLVKITLGTPILFTQERPGRYGRPFRIYKFRTMTDKSDAEGSLLPDGERLTTMGRFLRANSLDELPELLNVIKGDMSIVGPRPLLMQYLERYTPEQARRHEVKSGLTGWAQVNGRNTISWEEKFELDVWYVDHQSLWLDFRIIWMTVLTVLRREGINQQGHVGAEDFLGTAVNRRR